MPCELSTSGDSRYAKLPPGRRQFCPSSASASTVPGGRVNVANEPFDPNTSQSVERATGAVHSYSSSAPSTAASRDFSVPWLLHPAAAAKVMAIRRLLGGIILILNTHSARVCPLIC